MEPYLREGDHVLTFNWTKLKEKDVVVFKNKGEFYIKRVDRILNSRIGVSGDNKRLSSKIGAIDLAQVVGQVVLKY